jgi:hypothetical protein
MRKKNYKWYRRMKTTSERRANQDCEYVRAKRRPSNLPDPWDDKPIVTTKSWKDKRKHQHKVDGRGKKYSIEYKLEDCWWLRQRGIWELTQYFEDNDISYNIEKHRVLDYTYNHWRTGEPVGVYKTTHYTITWWSHKDICINHLI